MEAGAARRAGAANHRTAGRRRAARPRAVGGEAEVPRYTGWALLERTGAQVLDVRVGDGARVGDGDGGRATVLFEGRTVHLGKRFADTAELGDAPLLVVCDGDGDEAEASTEPRPLPAIVEAVCDARDGMRFGGVRRVLVPPTARASFPYSPLAAAGRTAPLTKLGLPPTADPALGVQSFDDAGFAPVPASEVGRALLEDVLMTNAFTMKAPERALLFTLEALRPGGGRGTGHAPTEEDRRRAKDVATEYDGGASLWVKFLPAPACCSTE